MRYIDFIDSDNAVLSSITAIEISDEFYELFQVGFFMGSPYPYESLTLRDLIWNLGVRQSGIIGSGRSAQQQALSKEYISIVERQYYIKKKTKVRLRCT